MAASAPAHSSADAERLARTYAELAAMKLQRLLADVKNDRGSSSALADSVNALITLFDFYVQRTYFCHEHHLY